MAVKTQRENLCYLNAVASTNYSFYFASQLFHALLVDFEFLKSAKREPFEVVLAEFYNPVVLEIV